MGYLFGLGTSYTGLEPNKNRPLKNTRVNGFICGEILYPDGEETIVKVIVHEVY